jgi:hypothetical protein
MTINIEEKDGQVFVEVEIVKKVKIGCPISTVKRDGYNGVARFLTEQAKYEVGEAVEKAAQEAIEKHYS